MKVEGCGCASQGPFFHRAVAEKRRGCLCVLDHELGVVCVVSGPTRPQTLRGYAALKPKDV